MLHERLGNADVQLLRILRQVDIGLGSAVELAPLVVHDAFSQRPVGRHLLIRTHRRVDVEATRIRVFPVLVEDQLTYRLSNVFRMYRQFHVMSITQRFGLGLLMLLGRDEAVLQHPVDDVLLADLGPARVGNRVVGRRRLWQAGQHGRFGHRDVLQGLAEVGFAGRREAIGTLAKEDLVHVELQDLVLAQQGLDLERQQDLVDLAGEGLLGGKVEVARDLHRDGRCPLAAGLAEVGQPGADHAEIVDTAVLIEARVLDRKDGLLHDLWGFPDRDELAALLAELADQRPVGRIDPHRQLGTVVHQAADFRQVGVGHGQGNGREDQHGEYSCHRQPRRTHQPLHHPADPRGRRGPRLAAGRLAIGIGHVPPRLDRRIIEMGIRGARLREFDS